MQNIRAIAAPENRSHKGWHSRGYLPHFDSPQTVPHVIFRTFDSLPRQILADLPKDGSARLGKIEAALDQGFGDRPLSVEANASAIENAMLHFDGQRYQLLAWYVMPSHVHAMVSQIQGFRLSQIVGSWKGYSARQINLSAGIERAFWAPDYFDRYMRNETQLSVAIEYIEQNPVAAGLVGSAADWKFSSARRRQARNEEILS